jgi:cobalt-zinc-cadmium efflux system membrane fusion protein
MSGSGRKKHPERDHFVCSIERSTGENIMYSMIIKLALLTLLSCIPITNHAQPAHEADHDEHSEAEEHEEGAVELNEAQQAEAGIVVESLVYKSLPNEILAPGEVVVNAYQSSQVTPRISAQITARHARLGDEVTKGQALVTLSSVDMAEAQGNLLVANQEWERVQELGREVVSERRYIEAQVGWQQAQAKVLAFGMTRAQIEALIAQNDVTRATGDFDLLAPQDGRIIFDDFVVGEVIEPGRVLYELTDESVIWVETSLTPEEAMFIESGNTAYVSAGNDWLAGTVIQSHHMLNETTRTLALRIEVPNDEERLHPGLFVDTRIQGRGTVDTLAVPENAVLRGPDGDWVVYMEESSGRYRPVEVELLRTTDGQAEISGLQPGTRVVVQGAFFIQSELAKGGFEVHAH